MQQKEYIKIGKLNIELFKKIGKHLLTDEVIFTYERINHVETKRAQLFNKIKRNKKENLLFKKLDNHE